MKTARLIVERGGTVVIFPEGTRHRTGSLGARRRGVAGSHSDRRGRAPGCCRGSEEVAGWRIRPRKVS